MSVDPNLPPAIKLDLPERNRSASFESFGGVYTTQTEFSLENVPDTAYCKPAHWQRNAKEEFLFNCIWDTPMDTLPYTMATVSVLVLPTPDTGEWEFERTSLTLKPVVREDKFMGNVLLIILSMTVVSIIAWSVLMGFVGTQKRGSTLS